MKSLLVCDFEKPYKSVKSMSFSVLGTTRIANMMIHKWGGICYCCGNLFCGDMWASTYRSRSR